ncbi:hypothetical protein SAMN05421505_14246 [Sinosporangium album]|uniref:Trypsin n=1 Tax=Sinosporangium album TaxID=504805 RepID=A0A1G8JCQ6_9ACTN|nr:hypothetical protein [Sinosporangium album]SDI29064.1 hypothetical protein SAMN05421505_14246 [Sinosporangium album]
MRRALTTGAAILAVAASAVLAGPSAGATATPTPGAPTPAAPTPAAPTPAEPTAGPAPQIAGQHNPSADFWAKQNRVTGVADAIIAARDKITGDSGYAGLITDPEKAGITLYWHGDVPASVHTAASQDAGVTVTTKQAPYTVRRLLTARDAVADKPQLDGASVVSVSPDPDGAGITVGVDREAGAGTVAAAAVQGTVESLAGGVAVTVVDQKAAGDSVPENPVPEVSADSRITEQAFAGARYINSRTGGYCSTGFAVWAANGEARNLTSAHCLPQSTDAALSPRGGWFASLGSRDAARDIATLRSSGGNPRFFQGHVYIGDENTRSTWPVRDYGRSYVGNQVCTSGGLSGGICGIRIDAVGVRENVRGTGWIEDAVRVSSTRNTAVWGEGDSGGPVLTIGNGHYAVANGIMVAAAVWDQRLVRRCIGAQTAGTASRRCSNVGLYIPLDRIFAVHGGNIVTG